MPKEKQRRASKPSKRRKDAAEAKAKQQKKKKKEVDPNKPVAITTMITRLMADQGRKFPRIHAQKNGAQSGQSVETLVKQMLTAAPVPVEARDTLEYAKAEMAVAYINQKLDRMKAEVSYQRRYVMEDTRADSTLVIHGYADFVLTSKTAIHVIELKTTTDTLQAHDASYQVVPCWRGAQDVFVPANEYSRHLMQLGFYVTAAYAPHFEVTGEVLMVAGNAPKNSGLRAYEWHGQYNIRNLFFPANDDAILEGVEFYKTDIKLTDGPLSFYVECDPETGLITMPVNAGSCRNLPEVEAALRRKYRYVVPRFK